MTSSRISQRDDGSEHVSHQVVFHYGLLEGGEDTVAQVASLVQTHLKDAVDVQELDTALRKKSFGACAQGAPCHAT